MSSTALTTLEQRCLAAGVLPWRVNWQTLAISPPPSTAISTEVCDWCARPTIHQAIGRAVERLRGRGSIPVIEISGGMIVSAIDASFGEGLVGIALTAAASAEHGKALRPFTHADRPAAERTMQLLRCTATDLARGDRDSLALEQFSGRMEQAFEETNLLFRLARLLKVDGEPRRQFALACEQIQEVLPFAWIAVRFRADTESEEMGLSGLTLFAGQPGDVAHHIEQAADAMTIEQWNRVLRPHTSPLAEASGGEVLADPILHAGRLVGVLLAGGKIGPDVELSSEEMQFMGAVAELLGNFHEKASRFHDQQSLFMGTIGALTAAIDAKDPYTRGHSERVALLASRLAAGLGLGDRLVERYHLAGLVHDVGKIGVSEAVLRKAGKLTDEEFAEIKRHPEVGHHILQGIPPLRDVLPGVLHHHERWDGRGYPHKLAGEAIPMIARVLALADTFDAMCSSRSYRSAISREQVLAEIRRCAGSQFDPQLVPTFLSLDFTSFDLMVQTAVKQAA